MRAVMVMYDSLNRHMLEPYGCTETLTPNFTRLAQRSAQFETCYAGSLPCMPARRELHTGRYNFLHHSWGPIEPYDDSMPEILKRNGVYTHLVSDHTHYWEDGGATYHNRYSSWEGFRGQEGDHWKGVVGGVKGPENLIHFTGYRGTLYQQDCVNRSYLKEEKDHPQTLTFRAGLDFIRTNAGQDNWMVQIETFDPHEPFFSYARYKALYPHEYEGPRFDWPDYAPVNQTPEQVRHGRLEYSALLSMCDHSLGEVLDLFDEKNLWEDTMLIVCTDHGYMLGEHGFWAKNYMPPYEEVVHTPLFIWDPRARVMGEKRKSLVQTIDIPATLLGFFGVKQPKDMQGHDLIDTIKTDAPVRDAALFGWFGRHVCITDGRYVYMRPPKPGNRPLHEYTLMPMHMAWLYSPEELRTMQRAEPFAFTKGCPVMRMDSNAPDILSDPNAGGEMLFDVQNDPHQQHPIENPEVLARLEKRMIQLMQENDAPKEQYERMNLTEKM